MFLQETLKEEFELQVQQLKRLTKHGPSLGRFVEILFLNLLKKYLPKSFEFSSGFIYPMDPTKEGQVSPQMDIICYDRINYPIIFDCGEIVVVSPKSVKGVIEVKSILTKSALKQILNLADCPASRETDVNTKFNLISLSSKLNPKSVYEFFKEHYESQDSIIRAMGLIYSLDWDEIILFETRFGKYEMYRLKNFNYGISSFINNFIMMIYGEEKYLSMANIIGTSLFIPIEKSVLFEYK